jgi:hypothetical protein
MESMDSECQRDIAAADMPLASDLGPGCPLHLWYLYCMLIEEAENKELLEYAISQLRRVEMDFE